MKGNRTSKEKIDKLTNLKSQLQILAILCQNKQTHNSNYTEVVDNTINYLNLIDIYRTLHPTIAE